MPTSHRITQALLYALLFLGFISVQAVAHWVSIKFGFWATIAELAGYAGIMYGAIRLLNRINHIWSDADIPEFPSDKAMMGIDDIGVPPPQVQVGHLETSVMVRPEPPKDQT